MNSIRRPRRRPRVLSVNFRSFGWVLVREAAIRVLLPTQVVGDGSDRARQMLARADTAAVRRIVEHGLAVRPERQYWLPRAE